MFSSAFRVVTLIVASVIPADVPAGKFFKLQDSSLGQGVGDEEIVRGGPAVRLSAPDCLSRIAAAPPFPFH